MWILVDPGILTSDTFNFQPKLVLEERQFWTVHGLLPLKRLTLTSFDCGCNKSENAISRLHHL